MERTSAQEENSFPHADCLVAAKKNRKRMSGSGASATLLLYLNRLQSNPIRRLLGSKSKLMGKVPPRKLGSSDSSIEERLG